MIASIVRSKCEIGMEKCLNRRDEPSALIFERLKYKQKEPFMSCYINESFSPRKETENSLKLPKVVISLFHISRISVV